MNVSVIAQIAFKPWLQSYLSADLRRVVCLGQRGRIKFVVLAVVVVDTGLGLQHASILSVAILGLPSLGLFRFHLFSFGLLVLDTLYFSILLGGRVSGGSSLWGGSRFDRLGGNGLDSWLGSLNVQGLVSHCDETGLQRGMISDCGWILPTRKTIPGPTKVCYLRDLSVGCLMGVTPSPCEKGGQL